MAYNWMLKFSGKEIHAPFIVEKDSDYYSDLRMRLTSFIKLLENAQADDISITIAKQYSNKVCEAVREYYNGNIGKCHRIIENLIRGCSNHELAVSELSKSRAFPGTEGAEIQFFRARKISDARVLQPRDMLHIPLQQRGKSGNYRFSIPGVISLYLANTSYGCWIEMDKPAEHDFYVSPVILDGSQKVFNLAVMSRDLSELNDGNEEFVHCWIKLLVLMIATSYKVEEANRTFRSEYIVSQSVMLACKKLGFDGVAYYSKRVEGELLSFAAINLALFVGFDRNSGYGSICRHLKIDEPMNYQLFKQLSYAATYQRYSLRVNATPYITNIGNYKRQYRYSETEFYRFDEHLFGRWDDREICNWGNALEDG